MAADSDPIRRRQASIVALGTKPGPVLDARDPLRSARAAAAQRFTEAGQLTLRRHRNVFWRWDGSSYRATDDEAIDAELWLFLESARQESEDGKHRPFKPTAAKVANVRAGLEAVSRLKDETSPPAWLEDAADLPPPAECFTAANGIIHLPSGLIIPPTPRLFSLNASGVTFDPNAPEPVASLEFLRQLFGADHEAIATLQDWFGYVLAPDTCQQKIMLMVGPARSGKGTIARVLRGLLGADSVCAPTLSSLSSNFGIEPLIGKTLAIISDARLGARSDQAAIAERLLSISGEDGQTIDRKHRSAWHGTMPLRFLILTNELPRLTDASGALAKRFILLMLTQTFYGREDPKLTDRLLAELPGILNWAREGYLRLRERGHFVQPQSSREAVDDLAALASPIKAFVEERCRLGAGFTIPCNRLFQEWRNWCADNGRKEHGTSATFGRDLKAAFPSIRTSQPRTNFGRERCYEGIICI